MGVLGDTIMLFVVISGVSSVFVGHRCGKIALACGRCAVPYHFFCVLSVSSLLLVQLVRAN